MEDTTRRTTELEVREIKALMSVHQAKIQANAEDSDNLTEIIKTLKKQLQEVCKHRDVTSLGISGLFQRCPECQALLG